MTVRRQRRLRAARSRKVAKRASAARRAEEALEMVRLRGLRRPQARPALRRPAPARRARPGDRQPPAGAAARRAARRARPQAAPGDAGRAQAHPAGGRHHLRLRHARPGGGADDERPPGRVQRRAGSSRSARPAEVYEQPGERVRRRLRRRLERARARRPPLHDPPREGPAARRGERATGCTSRTGIVRDVAYAGMVTRYLVELDARRRAAGRAPEPRDDVRGGARAARDGASRVGWREEQTFAIENRRRKR